MYERDYIHKKAIKYKYMTRGFYIKVHMINNVQQMYYEYFFLHKLHKVITRQVSHQQPYIPHHSSKRGWLLLDNAKKQSEEKQDFFYYTIGDFSAGYFD